MAEGRADTPGLIDPVIQWGVDEASPSGLAYFGGSLWVACLCGVRLFRIPVGADGALGDPAPLFVGRYGRLRTVMGAHRTAPCGSRPATATVVGARATATTVSFSSGPNSYRPAHEARRVSL
jgi:hypothetical protein